MRKILLLLVAFGCTSAVEKFTNHGEEITSEDAIGVEAFLSQVNEKEASYKVRATIDEVCQMKGCWMTLRNEHGMNVRVTFKDYGFFVPKDISGSEVIIEGLAQKEIIDEDLARHYAEDGGTTYDDSMRSTITFVAKGVLVKDETEKESAI